MLINEHAKKQDDNWIFITLTAFERKITAS
jgi:hypothetical protein